MERFLVLRTSLSSDAIHANLKAAHAAAVATIQSPPGNTSNRPLFLMTNFWEPYTLVRSFLRSGTGFLVPEFVDLKFVRHGISPSPPLVVGVYGAVKALTIGWIALVPPPRISSRSTAVLQSCGCLILLEQGGSTLGMQVCRVMRNQSACQRGPDERFAFEAARQ